MFDLSLFKTWFESYRQPALTVARAGEDTRGVSAVWTGVPAVAMWNEPPTKKFGRTIEGKFHQQAVRVSDLVAGSESDEAAVVITVCAYSSSRFSKLHGGEPAIVDFAGRTSYASVTMVTTARNAAMLQKAFTRNPDLAFDFLEAAGPRALPDNPSRWYKDSDAKMKDGTPEYVAVRGRMDDIRSDDRCNGVARAEVSQAPFADLTVVVDSVGQQQTANRSHGL